MVNNETFFILSPTVFQTELLRLEVPFNEKGVEFGELVAIPFCGSLYIYCIAKRGFDQKFKNLQHLS